MSLGMSPSSGRSGASGWRLGPHARKRWRLPILLTGILFANGRRTVTTWVRAAGVSDDYKDLQNIWRRTGGQLILCIDSPWDDPDRRPAHTNRRKSLRVQIMRNDLSTITATWSLPGKNIPTNPQPYEFGYVNQLLLFLRFAAFGCFLRNCRCVECGLHNWSCSIQFQRFSVTLSLSYASSPRRSFNMTGPVQISLRRQLG